MKKLGLYFHIPFCSGRCGYCSFVSGTVFSLMPQYHKRILEDIISYGEAAKGHGDMIHDTQGQEPCPRDTSVDTIYFGGGTPSVYFAGGLAEILKAVRENFKVTNECEITAEANPESLTPDKAREWKECGINRVSIGLQTLNEELLKIIGRRHGPADFFRAYENVVAAGIENISADVMLGLPGQTVRDAEDTISALCELPWIKHISAYALKLEEGTPLYNAERRTQNAQPPRHTACATPPQEGNCAASPSKPDKSLYKQITLKEFPSTEGCPASQLVECQGQGGLNDDLAADMYDAAYALLKQNGFARYEVSNFARAGYECRHNLKYWNLDEYLGIGAAAHSYYGGKRYAETNDINKYLSLEEFPSMEGCPASPAGSAKGGVADKTEYIMLKLRLERGIELADYHNKFGTRIEESAGARFLLKHNLIGASNGRLFILPEKFYVMNSIVLKILE